MRGAWPRTSRLAAESVGVVMKYAICILPLPDFAFPTNGAVVFRLNICLLQLATGQVYWYILTGANKSWEIPKSTTKSLL